jgi:hypothetical protein
MACPFVHVFGNTNADVDAFISLYLGFTSVDLYSIDDAKPGIVIVSLRTYRDTANTDIYVIYKE